jgi:hypothetical protein
MMKILKNSALKLSFIAAITIALIINDGCKKETYNDALPVVNLYRIAQIDTDSVSVTGTIATNNGDGIQYEGFSFGHDPVPPITERQIIASANSDTFTTHIYVKKDSTYYFRSFAANGYGYGLSAPAKFATH